MIPRHFLLPLALLILAPVTRGESFDIVIERPMEVGEKFEFRGTATSIDRTVANRGGESALVDETFLAGRLECLATVLEVDSLKRDKKIEIEVREARVTTRENGPERAALPTGTRVVAENVDGQEAFTINGRPVSDEVADFLSLFIGFPTSDVTEDRIWGATGKKAPGDTWPMNAEAMARDLASMEVAVDPANIQGLSTLEDVVEVDGVRCLRLSSDLEINGFRPPLPAGVEIVRSSLSGSFSGIFPVDPSLQVLAENYNVTHEIVASAGAAPGEVVELVITREKVVSMELRPVGTTPEPPQPAPSRKGFVQGQPEPLPGGPA